MSAADTRPSRIVSARAAGRRRFADRIVTVLVYACFALAVLPLISVLGRAP